VTYLTVRVRADTAAALRDRRLTTPEVAEVLRTIDELGASIEPLHPGSDDPRLAPYFRVEVPDQGTADRIAAELRSRAAVEAAYVKEPESPA
jgi:hypothetical protein